MEKIEELREHVYILLASFVKSNKGRCTKQTAGSDNFIVIVILPESTITHYVPMRLWDLYQCDDRPADVVIKDDKTHLERLTEFVKG